MSGKKFRSLTDVAAEKLRAEILSRPEGECLGSEVAVQEMIGATRVTTRQVARMLEGEGLLTVKRGQGGGYFTARPSLAAVGAMVSSYLEMFNASPEDLTNVASLLWIEAVEIAAAIRSHQSKTIAMELLDEVAALNDDATFDELYAVEMASRRAIFSLINKPYTELIFQINGIFLSKKLSKQSHERDLSGEHRDFVGSWKRAKSLELNAIAIGDVEIAHAAARLNRNLVYHRLWDFG